MKKLITLLLISWISISAQASDCPAMLTIGNPEWPNRIELTQGEHTRVFYFDKMHLTKKGNHLELTSPTVIFLSGIQEGPYVGFTFRELLMEDEESVTGKRNLSSVDMNTREIGCMEVERDFGRSGISYDKSMEIEKEDNGNYKVSIDIVSKREGTSLKAELNQVSYSEISFQEATKSTYQTSNGPIEGTIQYNLIYNEVTNQNVGLHINLDDEEISSFTVRSFEGTEGLYRLGTMGSKFLKVNQYHGASIDMDLYEFSQEQIAEVEGTTFFDFALGELLMRENEPIKVTNIKGVVALYGEENDSFVDLGAYYFDPEKALENGFHYEAIAQEQDASTVLDAWEHYSFKKLPAISLTHQSGEFKFVEKWEGEQLYVAFLPIEEEEEEKLDCDRIFGAAQKVVEEKYGPDGPNRDQETEMMQIFAETAAKEGLDIGDISGLDGNQIQDKLMSIAEQRCGGGRRMISEARERTAQIDAKGQLVSREYFTQMPNTSLLLSRGSGKLQFVAENEDQGKQSLEKEDNENLADMAMFAQIIGGIAFEEGKTYGLDFQDYKLTQSNSFSSGFGGGDRNIRKQTVYPVKAEFQLEVLGVEKIGGMDAYKIALHHKDYGDGHLLLTPVTGPRPGHSPYNIGAYLFVDKNNGTILQVKNEYEEVVFN